ncbi:MarR family winged helix-turn-helix transcriptional regulator [Salana multivorans]
MSTSPTDPIADLASRLRRGVLMTSRRLRSQRSADLTEGQYSALAQLDAHGPAAPSDLAARECVSAPSMTRTVGCLADAGLVERAPHPTDGRQVVVAITEQGREALYATRRRRDAWLATQLDGLPPDELEALGRAADILRRIATQ